MDDLTYAEVGATRGQLPAGYRHLRYRTQIGHGVMDAAREALLTWRMHEAAGVRVTASAARAAPDVTTRTSIGLGPLRVTVPCRVVWAVDGTDEAGFAYGTRPGHIARGEEAFLVTRDADGAVWFTVTAFSVPARFPLRGSGPLGPVLQRTYAYWCGRALRRLCRTP